MGMFISGSFVSIEVNKSSHKSYRKAGFFVQVPQTYLTIEGIVIYNSLLMIQFHAFLSTCFAEKDESIFYIIHKLLLMHSLRNQRLNHTALAYMPESL